MYDYFMKSIYEKKDMSSPEGAAFAQWFNNLDSGLDAFAGGSRYDREFEVHVGVPITEEFPIDFSLKRLDAEEIRTAVQRCAAFFDEYGLKAEPKVHIIGYDGSEYGI